MDTFMTPGAAYDNLLDIMRGYIDVQQRRICWTFNIVGISCYQRVAYDYFSTLICVTHNFIAIFFKS